MTEERKEVRAPVSTYPYSTRHWGGAPRTEPAKPIQPLSNAASAKLRYLHDNLAAEAKRFMCARCYGQISVAWNTGTWALRCKEGFSPDLIEEKYFEARRLGQMSIQKRPEQGIVYEAERGIVHAGPVEAQAPMTIEEFDQRQDLIVHVVSRMTKDVHYGQIPGTQGLTLYEPGAEYLRAAFNIQWDAQLVDEREDFVNHEYYYRYKAFQILSNGQPGPSWENSAWSKERKFWCASRQCERNCQGDHGPRGMEAQMLPNNVRDRAYKRAFVAMIRTVTGATGLFKTAAMDTSDTMGELDRGGDHATGNEGDHPWLVTCPVHKVNWVKSDKMREPAHKQGSGWCNQSVALKDLLEEQKAKLTEQWDPKAVNDWLKLNHGGTWSTYSAAQKISILQQIKTTPINGLPVDETTGEISNTTAPAEAPAGPATEEEGPPEDTPPDEGPPAEDAPDPDQGTGTDFLNDPARKQ